MSFYIAIGICAGLILEWLFCVNILFVALQGWSLHCMLWSFFQSQRFLSYVKCTLIISNKQIIFCAFLWKKLSNVHFDPCNAAIPYMWKVHTHTDSLFSNQYFFALQLCIYTIKHALTRKNRGTHAKTSKKPQNICNNISAKNIRK